MNLKEYKKLIEKYQAKYNNKLNNLKEKYYQCMINYDKEIFKNTMYEHRILIQQLIFEVINEFKEFKEIKCCVLLNGSFARASNTMFSDIDINYFYDNSYFEKMIKIEEKVNYLLQTILKFRGKDRIHSMVVYLPLIRNIHYDYFKTNKYPMHFDKEIIYNECRENAEVLMYETYNSTREVKDLINYLNTNDNEIQNNEWANCFKIIYDNGMYKKFLKKRSVFKGDKNILFHINNCLESLNNDNNYVSENIKEIEIKDLKYFYKMLVFNNFYQILSIYFRLNENLKSINIKVMEDQIKENHKILYDCFYYHLNLIQRLQYLLDEENIDFSFHSSKKIDINDINKKYFKTFKSKNIIIDLNISKHKLYNECKKNLRKEITNYE